MYSIRTIDRDFWTTDIVGQRIEFTTDDLTKYGFRINTNRHGLHLMGVGQNRGFILEINAAGKIITLLADKNL